VCRITVTFIDRDGDAKTVRVPVGENLLEAAHAHDIDLEVRVSSLQPWCYLVGCVATRACRLGHRRDSVFKGAGLCE
jgi:hypothetical protein